MSMPTTRVDLEQLQAAVRQLEDIKRYVEQYCVNYMPSISSALGSATNVDMSNAEYQFTREATVFGGFYSAYGMQAKNDTVYRAVDASLRELITHLDGVAQNLQTIIGNFGATEDANAQGNLNLERDVTSGPPVGTPPPGSSGTLYA